MLLRAIESRRPTLFHRAPPALKLGAALGLIVAIALLPRRLDALYYLPLGLLLLLWPGCRMSVGYTLRGLLIAEFFVLGIALLSLLAPSAAPLLLATIVKSNMSVFTLLLLTWTTPFQQILRVLRRLRLPAVMLTTLALMYRYLPVLVDETGRMQRARASRTFSRRPRLGWQNLAAMIGRLFVRSTDRAERIYLAMCARGWK